MWLADNWKEYEVIDCSEGEKLERWEIHPSSSGSSGNLGHKEGR